MVLYGMSYNDQPKTQTKNQNSLITLGVNLIVRGHYSSKKKEKKIVLDLYLRSAGKTSLTEIMGN